jgi:hypothetical protein
MTPLALALALVLAAPGTPARNARQPSPAQALDPLPDPPPPRGKEMNGPTAEALSDAEVAARVETYLGAIDTPVPPARWKALGARAVGPLVAVVEGKAFPSERAHALEALSHIGGARAKEALLTVARSDREAFAVRASALRGAARVVPAGELPAVLGTVLERAKDAPVRAVAAEVLANHAPGSGCAAVRAQVAREAAEARPAFGAALGRCGAAP